MNYYNEFDPKAAAWLRELMKAGHIPPGEIDERSISDVKPDDLRGFNQCHFFAGIGGWALALQLAGWPEDRPVWTGSCPCQPWSIGNVAHGGAQGKLDARHLWPDWFRLIAECQPDRILGEQVASAIKMGWLDEVFGDLEAQDYSCWARVLRAKDFGFDHERKRVFFMADAGGKRRQGYKQIERFPISASTAQPINGNTAARARNALAGDYGDLLPCDGLSVTMERHALKGYGNAIVPAVAAEFIKAYQEAKGIA